MSDPQRLRDVLAANALLLTPEEAATVLRIGRTTVYALIKAGQLRPVHIGRSCRLPRAELERYVRYLETSPDAAPTQVSSVESTHHGTRDAKAAPPHAACTPGSCLASPLGTRPPPSTDLPRCVCRPGTRGVVARPESTDASGRGRAAIAEGIDVARRANGEGSIFRRKDGSWSPELSYRDEYGTLRRRTVYGKSQAEARAKFREARERIESGAPVKDASMTVAAWLEDWISKSLAASDRKQATKDLYATLARTHLVPTVGPITLGRLRPSDVEALVVTKRDAGLAGSTIRTVYTVLRSALDIAVRDGLIRKNPAAAVRRPGVERRDAPHLTADQAQALLEAIKGDRLESLFRVMLATGLRRGEALGLHWSDVDLDAGLLRVRWTLARTSKGLQLEEPKTDKSRRTVPLPRSAIEALRAHEARQMEERCAAAEVWREHGLAFTTEVGTPLEPRNVLRRFEVLAQRAGLRDVTLHTLRHSAASFLLAAGTHTKVVQEHLGHSSYAITADIYSHVGPAQQREAADRLDQALRW